MTSGNQITVSLLSLQNRAETQWWNTVILKCLVATHSAPLPLCLWCLGRQDSDAQLAALPLSWHSATGLLLYQCEIHMKAKWIFIIEKSISALATEVEFLNLCPAKFKFANNRNSSVFSHWHCAYLCLPSQIRCPFPAKNCGPNALQCTFCFLHLCQSEN